MVEFALLLPIFLVVIFIIVDFGVGISRWVILTNSTREGARLGAVGAVTADITDKVVSTSNDLLDPADVNVYYLDGPDSNLDPGDRGDSVIVETNYQYGLITPLSAFLSLAWDSIDFHSCTDMRLELGVSGAGGGGPGCD
ncbi:MAG: TadE family protein [Dehalococcoidia bacterium]